MLKAVVFDLDGTLTVLALPLDAMRGDTKEYYLKRGMPAGLLEPEDGISSSTLKAKDYFLSQGVSPEVWDRMQAEIDKILSAHEGWAATDARLIDGSLEVIRELKARGLKTAILTNNGRGAVDQILRKIPLSGLFDVIQTRHESPSPKPYPDGLWSIVEKLGVGVDEAVYVGDARIDAAAANRAGLEFWGVATGETPKDALIKAGAARVFDSLKQILDALGPKS
ncbi:MAG: HAD family hydrolase [Candidatus Thorarchaeota archaeon]|jgi:phosphoglycolate phosphatase